MPTVTRYTCRLELLPMVEAALAANGYVVEAPLTKQINGATPLVMTYGTSVVLLAHTPPGDLAEIEVWGETPSAAIALLDSLPIPLHKQPQCATPRR